MRMDIVLWSLLPLALLLCPPLADCRVYTPDGFSNEFVRFQQKGKGGRQDGKLSDGKGKKRVHGDPSLIGDSGTLSSLRGLTEGVVCEDKRVMTDVFWDASRREASEVVIIVPGFLQSKNRHTDQALQLASRGFVAVVPSPKRFADHAKNAKDISRLIDWLGRENGDRKSPLFSRLDMQSIGLLGHSAGGLAAVLCAAHDFRVSVLSLMDPVDFKDMGKRAARSGGLDKCAVGITCSDPSPANKWGDPFRFFDAMASVPLRRLVHVQGASHSDPQCPTNWASRWFCGQPGKAYQRRYFQFSLSWMDLFLKGKVASALPWAVDRSQIRQTAGESFGMVSLVDRLGGLVRVCRENSPADLHGHVSVQRAAGVVDFHVGDLRSFSAAMKKFLFVRNERRRTKLKGRFLLHRDALR
uniref:PET hydrolase/cutinase-like domain-containing protein n=1 Tax=Chromera velia CCMP2878 TaxID=1169474 RepID=A0A0G4I3V2_9ALVE|eukprot:Cvel_10770.t1-p1 / transcript=Cvel_10770.t1 / gene=Cvel_10770 / organism=Chromera_velia_CCMP2878 / gene_product=hypothetical protein / transcript_product=hypothetical protein / location=Cvel_scaffold658:4077-6094(+) / protein_length=411 / sequence_SO=supercontig / SO=protein_coding / is_pseudo=false